MLAESVPFNSSWFFFFGWHLLQKMISNMDWAWSCRRKIFKDIFPWLKNLRTPQLLTMCLEANNPHVLRCECQQKRMPYWWADHGLSWGLGNYVWVLWATEDISSRAEDHMLSNLFLLWQKGTGFWESTESDISGTIMTQSPCLTATFLGY